MLKEIIEIIAVLIVITIAAGTVVGAAYAVDYMSDWHVNGSIYPQ